MANTFDDYESSQTIPEGIKSRLRRIALEQKIKTINAIVLNQNTSEFFNRDVQNFTGNLVTSEGIPITQDNLENFSLGTILLQTPNGFLNVQAVDNEGASENVELYTAVNGITYKLTIEQDTTNTFELARRRFGAARTIPENVIVFRSPVTFALDDNVILNDVKAQLDAQLNQNL